MGWASSRSVQNSLIWPLLQAGVVLRLLAFTLNTAAYTTEILRGAIEVTPAGEIEAAKAAGMSPLLMLRRIILPSAFRRALPGLRQRGDLHAARQCRGQRGDARRPHRRRAAGAVAYLRAVRGIHHRGVFYLVLTFAWSGCSAGSSTACMRICAGRWPERLTAVR